MNDLILTEADLRGLALVAQRPGDQQAANIYLAGLAESSRRTMANALANVSHLLTGQSDYNKVAWSSIRFQHVKLIRTVLSETYAPSTANRHLAALRGVLRSARRLRRLTADDYLDCLDESKRIRGSRVARGRHVSAGEIAAIMTACMNDSTPSGCRDAAVVGLLAGLGLRRAELVDLNRANFDEVSSELIVRGKGNKERKLDVLNGSRAALDDWLKLRGQQPGALFSTIRKGGHIWPGRLTAQSVMDILLKRQTEAGVQRFSPHDLRRTLAGNLLDAGEDISTVQQILGHSSVTTTQQYDRRPAQARRAALDKIHIPYRR